MKRFIISIISVICVMAIAATYTISQMPNSKKAENNKLSVNSNSADYNKGKREIAEIARLYSKVTSVSAKFTILLEDNRGRIIDKGLGMLVQDTSGYYVRTLDFEQVVNNEYTIVLSHDEKTISYSKISHSDKEFLLNSDKPSILWTDSLQLIPDSIIKWEQTGKNTGKLSFELGGIKYWKTEILYESDSKRILEIRQYINNYEYAGDEELAEDENNGLPATVVYKFDKLDINVNVDRSVFSTSRFLTVNGDIAMPKAKYREYEPMSEPE